MRFNYTNGKEARYLVAIHYELIDDYYYFSRFNEAKKLFDFEANEASACDTACTIVLSDLKTDIRKAFVKVGR